VRLEDNGDIRMECEVSEARARETKERINGDRRRQGKQSKDIFSQGNNR